MCYINSTSGVRKGPRKQSEQVTLGEGQLNTKNNRPTNKHTREHIHMYIEIFINYIVDIITLIYYVFNTNILRILIANNFIRGFENMLLGYYLTPQDVKSFYQIATYLQVMIKL